jgi:hypothetical protein
LGATAEPIEVSAREFRPTGTTGAAGADGVGEAVGEGLALVVAAAVAALAVPAMVGSAARAAAAPSAREAAAVAVFAERLGNVKRASIGWRAIRRCIDGY